jgi:LysM repeat protein
MSACVVLASCILPFVAMVGLRVPGPAQASSSTAANISTASSTSTSNPVILTSESVTAKTAAVTAHPAGRAATWTVQPGDTLTAIATELRVSGGWQALYAANRRAVGPDPNLIRAGTVLVLPGTSVSARYIVAPGDTLSGIAAALGIPGGWQALYAANRSAVGSNPNSIRSGLILATPRQATQGHTTQGQAPRASAPASTQLRYHASPAPAEPTQAPPVLARPSHLTAPVTAAAAGGMPRWLEDVLLAAGVLAASAFAAEPAAALARRRKATGLIALTGAARPAQPARPARPGRHRVRGGTRDLAKRAAAKARIILADHERLIVTYSIRDHTVYVLTPPGEDPMAVLAAARLVLPEDTYKDLAGHLGVPSAWRLD